MARLVIDTDPGIDDALALLFALASPRATIEAVTTVAGNVGLPLATRNARRVFRVAASDPPPIVPGAARPLARPLVTAAYYHGADGLGDALPPEPDPGEGDPGPTVDAAPALIVEMARRLGGMLTVVALGPLTNLAHALELDPTALGRVGRLVVMGGAVDVPGNVTPRAEFNMHVDPEAAARVLAGGVPIELVPLDVTRRVVLRRRDLDPALRDAPPALGAFVDAITRAAFPVGERAGEGGIALHDPLAVGVALDPSLVTFEAARLRIGPDGETRREPGPPNCRVAVAVDAPRFLRVFRERLCRASS